MYESFFGFKEKPFNITPDPKYLYLSEQHQEAIAHLLYGIQERGGFVVVTGEIGTGKTTLCRYLINQMDDRTEGAIIFNPNLSEIELLKSINEDFGIISTGQTKKELVDELNQFLLEERLRGKNMVLIIDEAQNLHPAVLEQIRMLSNLETEKEKLIQIILTGQPQLKRLLARPELRQLDQRITARYHLKPLNRKETYEYIRHRLEVATNGDHVAFERAAMKQVYRFAKGIPRLINVVCDRALLGAFAVGQGSPVPKKIVKQAIREVTGPRFPLRSRLSFIGTSARAVAYLFVIMFALTLAALLGWYGITTLGALRSPDKGVTEAELIPDLPFERGTEASALVESAGAETPSPALPVGAEPASAEQPVVDAPPPMAPYSEEEKKKLTEVLLAQSYGQSRLSAARNLLSLWGDSSELGAEDVVSLYGLAVSRQMRCTELWTNFDGLRCSNAPCILEMFIPQELRPRYVVLAELGESDAKILSADSEPLVVPLHLLDEFWLRRAFIFWKDFEHLNEIMKMGDSGDQVVWLQAGLKTLGLYNGLSSGEFDGPTEVAVREFQRQNSLLLDGIVGPKTKLALYANLPQYSMPRLNGESI